MANAWESCNFIPCRRHLSLCLAQVWSLECSKLINYFLRFWSLGGLVNLRQQVNQISLDLSFSFLCQGRLQICQLATKVGVSGCQLIDDFRHALGQVIRQWIQEWNILSFWISMSDRFRILWVLNRSAWLVSEHLKHVAHEAVQFLWKTIFLGLIRLLRLLNNGKQLINFLASFARNSTLARMDIIKDQTVLVKVETFGTKHLFLLREILDCLCKSLVGVETLSTSISGWIVVVALSSMHRVLHLWSFVCTCRTYEMWCFARERVSSRWAPAVTQKQSRVVVSWIWLDWVHIRFLISSIYKSNYHHIK